jgi:hypothetical protein
LRFYDQLGTWPGGQIPPTLTVAIYATPAWAPSQLKSPPGAMPLAPESGDALQPRAVARIAANTGCACLTPCRALGCRSDRPGRPPLLICTATPDQEPSRWRKDGYWLPRWPEPSHDHLQTAAATICVCTLRIDAIAFIEALGR